MLHNFGTKTVNKMILRNAVTFYAVLGLAQGLDDLSFPPGFKFGVASAAYQIEGGWNVSDKSESIWDRFCHTRPEMIADSVNGDVACDSYHLWRRDVEMIEEVGAHFYRFSIDWSRLLPNGFANVISEDGKNYYSNLIDGLLEKGIEPVVTLYHWDMPQSLQDLGGWTNPLIADWFADYARVAFSLYGDRVKTWITINEPVILCEYSYNTGMTAPGILEPEVASYLCSKHVLLAHAKAWRIYDEQLRYKYNGKVALTNYNLWIEPLTPADEKLAELAIENLVGRYSHPIYSKAGDWPPAIKEAFSLMAKEKGLRRSKLPAFTAEEIELVRGTYDYYGINFYTSRTIRSALDGEIPGAWPFEGLPEFNGKMEHRPEWKSSSAFWFFLYPEGLRKQLAWIKKQYGDIPILITENGYPTKGGLDDVDRINFYRDHLEQVLLAIKEDGVNVTGYTAWTLMDNFEWGDGYTIQFGLYQVDFSSPLRTRTARASAAFYRRIIQQHSLNITTKGYKMI